MSFGEIARHILIASHGLTGLLLEGEEQLNGPLFREKMAKYALLPPGAAPADLARELRASMEQRIPQLAAQSAEFYAGIVTRVDGAASHTPRNVAVRKRARTHTSRSALSLHALEG